VGKTYAMTGPQLHAATAAHVVNLQGSNVRASPRTVIVVPTTVGVAATPTELRHDLATQVPLSYRTLTFSHVYIIHSPVSSVEFERITPPCE
jgi:hypothetical protein